MTDERGDHLQDPFAVLCPPAVILDKSSIDFEAVLRLITDAKMRVVQIQNDPRIYTPKVKRLPVFQSISRSGISARILAMKLRPVQCIGITTSGASAFISEIVCSI